MTIDEKIAKEKANAEKLRKIIETGYDGEISIEALFCDDTDAIKEAYERFENCAEEHEQIAEWLEELKAYRQYIDLTEIPEQYKLGFQDGIIAGNNKAIDDFANACKSNILCQTCGLRQGDIEEMAEKLKAGGENDNLRR